MTDKSIHILYSDEGDWIGIYLDGKLAYENHSIETEQLLTMLDIPYKQKILDFHKNEWRRCPDLWKDAIDKPQETMEQQLQRIKMAVSVLSHEYIDLGGEQSLLDELGIK